LEPPRQKNSARKNLRSLLNEKNHRFK
jgi:hypothetical protein